MSYEELDYAGLQAALKEKGLKASGTKEELLARLQEADATPSEEAEETPEETQEETTEEETEEETPEEEASEEEPEETPAPKVEKPKLSDMEVEKELRTDAAKMKAHLAKQKKVSVMIPLEQGVSPEVAEKVPFVVNLNGYRLSIKRGVFVEVPEQIADMIKERLESEGKIGSKYRLDRNPDKMEALG